MDEKVEELIDLFYDDSGLSLWTVARTSLFCKLDW
jgi:hypothetical protein